MLAFLRAFLLALAAISLLGGTVVLWTLGLTKPADALADRGRLNLATGYMAVYFLVTVATVAGVVAVASGAA